MTEDDARQWLVNRLSVPRETMANLGNFLECVIAENGRQNLISRSTECQIWARHAVDSAQLLPLAAPGGTWIDLGSGSGFPGMVIAVIGRREVTLVEARRRRVEFLNAVVGSLNLGARVQVEGRRAETIDPLPFDTISARAFAPIERLFEIGVRFAGPTTRWLLPKGRSAQAELEAAERTWQGKFRIEPSVTDPDSAIIVAEQVRPRKQR